MTIAVFLVLCDRRWLTAVVPLACLMAVALVESDYHVTADIAGGAAFGVVAGATVFTSLSRGRLRQITDPVEEMPRS